MLGPWAGSWLEVKAEAAQSVSLATGAHLLTHYSSLPLDTNAFDSWKYNCDILKEI